MMSWSLCKSTNSLWLCSDMTNASAVLLIHRWYFPLYARGRQRPTMLARVQHKKEPLLLEAGLAKPHYQKSAAFSSHPVNLVKIL